MASQTHTSGYPPADYAPAPPQLPHDILFSNSISQWRCTQADLSFLDTNQAEVEYEYFRTGLVIVVCRDLKISCKKSNAWMCYFSLQPGRSSGPLLISAMSACPHGSQRCMMHLIDPDRRSLTWG